MRATRLIAIVLIGIGASACIPFPRHEVVSGSEISVEEVLFIEPGITTKRQVLERLGAPSVIWEDQRVLVYNWDVVEWQAYGIPLVIGQELPILDIPIQHLLLLQFDETERVTKIERTTRPFRHSYGEFLREWVSKK